MKTVTYLLLGLALGAAMPQDASSRVFHGETNITVAASMMQGGNQINGHIFNSEGRPVPEIYVELLNDYYQYLGRAKTDSSGFFLFNNISSGNFKVRVITSGTDYLEQTQDVTITNFGRGTPGNVRSSRESRQVSFTLMSKREKVAAMTNTPGTVFVQEVPEVAKKTYEKAVQDIEGGKKDEEGIGELKKAIEEFPNYYLALERLGSEYVKRGEFQPATTVLAKAVEVYPRGYQSLQLLGVAYYNLKQREAAIEMFNRAVSVSPTSINAQLWLGITLRQAAKFDEAEAHLKRANELGKGKVPETHWQLALLYNQRQHYTEAADELELFLKTQPDSRDVEGIKRLIQRLREKAAGQSARQ